MKTSTLRRWHSERKSMAEEGDGVSLWGFLHSDEHEGPSLLELRDAIKMLPLPRADGNRIPAAVAMDGQMEERRMDLQKGRLTPITTALLSAAVVRTRISRDYIFINMIKATIFGALVPVRLYTKDVVCLILVKILNEENIHEIQSSLCFKRTVERE